MRLYEGTSQEFIQDAVHNAIAEKLTEAFFEYFRFRPSPAEINSWRNSLNAISNVFQFAKLFDHGVILEYQLPLTSKRLDCMICGVDPHGDDNAVIIELKQWSESVSCSSENEVLTWVGGKNREVLHPAVQVGQYKMYLEDVHTAFYGEKAVQLDACAYLHNYSYVENDPLLDPKFEKATETAAMFSKDDVDILIDYLNENLRVGDGMRIIERIKKGEYRPSKKLMDHVGKIVKQKSEYVLLDEQLVAYDKVLSVIKDSHFDKQKHVVIIKGGPGTGKSVIALNLMADLLIKGYNTHYSTGSKSLTETLRKILGARGAAQCKYFNSYTKVDPNSVDVIICDEAHRLRKTSNNMYTKKEARSDMPQIQEIFQAARVNVFFIDDKQVVRPDEVGSVQYIKELAEKDGYLVHEYELEAQFRCNGSDAFVNWVSNTLGIERTANVIWDKKEEFDFQVFDSPLELENAIKEKVEQGNTGRMTAGFCWPWSKSLVEGKLCEDVVVGDFKRPWNARPEMTGLPKDIPKAALWAYDPNGIHQVGCVYTAQGFEFDYVGIIMGPDLVYDFEKGDWKGQKECSYDSSVKKAKENFIELVKNTYCVLFTRGMKGCYVYFVDEDTKKFFKSRMG